MISGLADVMRDMENGTYNFCKDGNCSCCGQCCSNLLPMTNEEIKEIKHYIKANGIKAQNHLIPTNAMADLTCPFLDTSKEKKCTIYEVRPRICRDFICDPKQRKVPNMDYARKCSPTFVRETFFGG